jgi:hypothetical protein
MMAHDSSVPRPDLSASTVASLEKALAAFLADPTETSQLERALSALTKEARDKQVHAEQLLVVLKDVWFALPAIRQVPSGETQNALLQRVVTQCIRQYYSG